MGTLKQFPSRTPESRAGSRFKELVFIIDLGRRSPLAREALEKDYEPDGTVIPFSFMEVLWDSILEELSKKPNDVSRLSELFDFLHESFGQDETVDFLIEKSLLENLHGERNFPTVDEKQVKKLSSLLGPKLRARLKDVALRLDGPE